MVYCVKCGTKNLDDANMCSKCGAPLSASSKDDKHRRMENECFGIPRGGTFVGLAIGVIILLAGCIWFLQQTGAIPSNIGVMPFAMVIFGILLIAGAIYGIRRRQ